jgi:hypothetical protein
MSKYLVNLIFIPYNDNVKGQTYIRSSRNRWWMDWGETNPNHRSLYFVEPFVIKFPFNE